MYKSFLETYISRSTFNRYGDLQIGEKIYKTCLKLHLSIDISPNDLQKYGLMKMKEIIFQIENITKKTHNNLIYDCLLYFSIIYFL